MKKLFLILFFTISLFHTSLFAQWIQQSVPVTMPITGIKFININTGWACTGTFNVLDTGYIINTTNGGTTWNIQLFYPAMKFTDIEFIDQSTGYISGNHNDSARTKLFTTTNGGANWNYINMIPNMSINDMQFINKDSAWECGASAGPDVRTTTDGGNTWIVRTSGIMSATQRIFFLNYNTGFCGASTFLYKTINAGLNWSLQGSFSTLVQSIFFLNIDTGWVGLSPTTTAHIGYTSNGGLNWSIQNLEPYNININSIFFFNNTIGFAGVAFNKIYKTTNTGILWGYQNNSGSNRISFIDTSIGWSGWNGISYTTNGGGTITYVGIISINNNVPHDYVLYQNYPNPFNSQTNIRFSLVRRSLVQFRIYDITGKEMTVWKSDKEMDAGTHELQFEANDFSSGVYFYQMVVNDIKNNIIFKETKKMLMVK